MQRFTRKGRFTEFMSRIPLHVSSPRRTLCRWLPWERNPRSVALIVSDFLRGPHRFASALRMLQSRPKHPKPKTSAAKASKPSHAVIKAKQRLAAWVQLATPSSASGGLLREIPNLFILAMSVVLLNPSLTPAPFGPPMTQPACSSISRMRARSDSPMLVAGEVGTESAVRT